MKKKGSLFSKALVISFCIVLINLGFIVLKNFQSGAITGYSVNEIKDLRISNTSMILFFVQVFFLVVMLGFIFFYDKKKNKEELDDIGFEMLKPHSNETDLDILYQALKKRKKIALSKIARSFKINKDVAMEWCKILESGELATIDYPGFGEPKLILNEAKEEKIIAGPKEIHLVSTQESGKLDGENKKSLPKIQKNKKVIKKLIKPSKSNKKKQKRKAR